MKKLLCVFMLMCYGVSSFAAEVHKAIIDIYGTNQLTVPRLQQSLGKQFQLLADGAQAAILDSGKVNFLELKKADEKIISEVNKMGSFAYVNVTPVVYPKSKDVYFTLDIVERSDIKRLSYFQPKPTQSFADPDNLIRQWQEYEKAALKEVPRQKLTYLIADCQSFNCFNNFEGGLAKYRDIFMEGVPKNQDKLMQILRNDKDDSKRASAALLLANSKDGNELIKILQPSMRDSSAIVRSNAMTVISAALFKLKTVDFPIEEAIAALDYPVSSDRSNAMMILQALSSQTRYSNYIKNNARPALIAVLKQQQPNIHDSAFLLLQSISNKKYGERDYNAWEKWLATESA